MTAKQRQIRALTLAQHHAAELSGCIEEARSDSKPYMELKLRPLLRESIVLRDTLTAILDWQKPK